MRRHEFTKSKYGRKFAGAVSRIPQIDPYGGVGLADADELAGNPIDDVLGSVRGQMQELRNGLTLAAAASAAAAIGVVLLLLTMPSGGRKKRRR